MSFMESVQEVSRFLGGGDSVKEPPLLGRVCAPSLPDWLVISDKKKQANKNILKDSRLINPAVSF